jgi:hypothetical protein
MPYRDDHLQDRLWEMQTHHFENLLRIDLRTMTVIPTNPDTVLLGNGPDFVGIDHSLHLLFMAGCGGITTHYTYYTCYTCGRHSSLPRK